MQPRFEPYKSRKNGKWYWRLVAANGRKIATGNESFERRPKDKFINTLIRVLQQCKYSYKK